MLGLFCFDLILLFQLSCIYPCSRTMFNQKCCNNSKLRFQNPEAICLAPKWAQRALGGCLFKQSVNGYCDDGAWCYCEDVVSGAVEDQLTSGKSWSHTFWHLLLWCCECSYSGGWRTIAKFGGELVTHFGDECDNGVNCECYWRGVNDVMPFTMFLYHASGAFS